MCVDGVDGEKWFSLDRGYKVRSHLQGCAFERHVEKLVERRGGCRMGSWGGVDVVEMRIWSWRRLWSAGSDSSISVFCGRF